MKRTFNKDKKKAGKKEKEEKREAKKG